MLTTISDAMTAQLQTIDGIRHVGEWAGQVEELLATAQPTPSLHLVYTGARFGEGPVAIGTRLLDVQLVWSVILLSKNHRSRSDGALEAYELIDQVRDKLTGFVVGDGQLWPRREGLILAKNGLLGYGLDYQLDTRTT